jgi:hypothetical protein
MFWKEAEHQKTSARLYGITFKMIELFIVTAVRTLNLT